MKAAVEMEDVHVAFNGRDVVRGVSASLPDRGISVIIGRSGCGKTTLLRVLNRLNEEFPGCRTSGRVELNLGAGPEAVYPAPGVRPRPLPELRRLVGMVFQSPNVFPVSVFHNIAIPLLTVAECPKSELADRVRKALEDVGLWKDVMERLHMPAEHLSGGQQQRLCLARTLALEPSILLLDEPTASLDVHATAEVEELLRNLAERYPLIMVSHSLRQALQMGDRLLVMENGMLTHRLEGRSSTTERELSGLLGVAPERLL